MTTCSPVRSARAAAFLFLGAMGLVGCGAAAPAYPPEPALPPTPEGSLAALDRAESDLMLALGGRTTAATPGAPAAGAGAQPTYAQPPAPPPPSTPDSDRTAAKKEPSDRPREDVTVSAGATMSDPCSSACRALASMRRAAVHLCNLSGEGDARCDGARQRVTSASERVQLFCPMCSAAGE